MEYSVAAVAAPLMAARREKKLGREPFLPRHDLPGRRIASGNGNCQWLSGVVLAPFMTPGSAHRSPADTRVAAFSVSSSARGRWKSSGQSSATQ